MRNRVAFTALCAALTFSSSLAVESASGALRIGIDLAGTGKQISPDLFGIFFEDLNYAADGGLYAELIQNRSFEYSATEQSNWGPLSFWNLVQSTDGEGNLGVGDSRPIHTNNPHYLLLTVLKPGKGVGVSNTGFDQIPIEGGKAYIASFWAYQAFMGKKWGDGSADQNQPMPMLIRLESEAGEVLAETQVSVLGREWTKYTATLTPKQSEAKARFVLLAQAQGGLAIDSVSLFPHDTFKGRPNGLRRDLAQAIADLHPKFVRFPGGCLVHGSGPRHYYDWKGSVGPVERRKHQRNLWGYHQTLGLGYFEYFQFCEDIGAIPLPVVAAGVCCQHGGDSPGRGQEGLPMTEMPSYIQDVLDLIEWANGPAESKWGSVRAAAGHPKPFGLRYLGLGNEDAITPVFKERFKMICDVLRERHPEIVVIGTSGPFPTGEDFELGWTFARDERLQIVDEHYYMPPQWFWENRQRYDSYDRKGPKVYVGEYAAHDTQRRNTLRSALAEAAACVDFERNGDLVQFASYAPLLARRGHTQWTPDLIYFDATRVYPSLNYEVQRLFSTNSGDVLLPADIQGVSTGAKVAISVVRDSRSGDVIIKAVNGENHPLPATINLVSGTAKSLRLKSTRFTGDDPDVVNVDGEPPAIVASETEDRVEPEFRHTFPAHSLTILRLN